MRLGIAAALLLPVISAHADPLPKASFVLDETQGQSLGVGARGLPIINATPPSPGCALMPNDVWKTRGSGDLPSSAPSITGIVGAYETDGIGQGYAPGFFGETHLTAEMAQLCAWKQGMRYIGRSSAATGKDIASISSGTRPYANGLADVRRLSELVGQSGGSLVVQGISFIHGDTDRNQRTDPLVYADRVKQLVADTNADWRSATGQGVPIRYGIMQLSANASGRSSPIVQAQFDLALGAQADPLIDLIGPRYPFPLNSGYPSPPGDGLHLSSRGYVMMGEYIAKWRWQTFMEGKPWRPLYPVSIVFSMDRRTVNLVLNVPRPPVAIDTNSILQGAAPDYGLAFHDDCRSVAIAANGIAVAGPRLIRIALTAPSTCSNPMLQAAWDGQWNHADTTSGAWTNIRDSDPTVSRSANKLYNWLVAFSLPVRTPRTP